MATLLYFLQNLQSAKQTAEKDIKQQGTGSESKPVYQDQQQQTSASNSSVTLDSSVDVDTMRLFVPNDWNAEKQLLEDETKVLIRSPENHKPLPLTLEVIIRDEDDPRTVPFGSEYQKYIKTLGRYSVNVISGSTQYHDPSRKVFTIQERTYYFDEAGKRYFITLRYYSNEINPDIEVLADEIIRNGIY